MARSRCSLSFERLHLMESAVTANPFRKRPRPAHLLLTEAAGSSDRVPGRWTLGTFSAYRHGSLRAGRAAMFGRNKRKDAPDQTGPARAPGPIVTAATEPVLPPPPPPAAAPPAPPVAENEPPPAPPIAPAPAPEAASDVLSQADIRARTLLADSIARMESRLSQPEPPPAPMTALESLLVPAAGTGAVEALAQSVAHTASEVARALEQMSSMCAMLAERLDADRQERRGLHEAVARL